MTKLKANLPDKLSDLVEVALRDLLAAEQAGIKISMSWWIKKSVDGRPCRVCLAGAALIGSLDEEAKKQLFAEESHSFNMEGNLDFSLLEYDTASKMFVLDEIRTAEKNNQIATPWNDDKDFIVRRSICPFEQNREQFVKDIRAMITDMRSEGL